MDFNYEMNSGSSNMKPPVPTMTSSTSQIFATAAAFNLSQNDAVFYSRETMHLLAKFLANHSDNSIFRSLYAYAPDNLAWLWAFFNWESPIEFEQAVPSQDAYAPFDSNTDALDEEQVRLVNKIFAEAPLIQYKYRENIMIGDVYKFIEHVQKIQVAPIARALFLLYFPRFADYLDNQLVKFMKPKILKTNLSRVKAVDEMVKSLIKSRYTNLDEYKHKILTGTNLPSYVSSLLNENGFWQVTSGEAVVKKTPSVKEEKTEDGGKSREDEEATTVDARDTENSVVTSATTKSDERADTSVQSSSTSSLSSIAAASLAPHRPANSTPKKDLCKQASGEIDTISSQHLNLLGSQTESGGELTLASTIAPISEAFSDRFAAGAAAAAASVLFEPALASIKTSDYLKLLEKSTRINNDLDHVSFDNHRGSGGGVDLCSSEHIVREEDLEDLYEDAQSNPAGQQLLDLKDHDLSSVLAANENENLLLTETDLEAATENAVASGFYADLLYNTAANASGVKGLSSLANPAASFYGPNRNGSLSNMSSPRMARKTDSIDLSQTIHAKPFVLGNKSVIKQQQQQAVNPFQMADASFNQTASSGQEFYSPSPNMEDSASNLKNFGKKFDYNNNSLSNAASNNSFSNQYRCLNNSNLANTSSSSSCMSPLTVSPRALRSHQQQQQQLYNTPKSPNSSNLNQYFDAKLPNNGGVGAADQVWSTQLPITPPPSAGAFKAMPLSIITADQEPAPGFNSSPFAGNGNNNNHRNNLFTANQQFLLNQLDVSQALQDESLSRYLKHSAFISSPVARLPSNRINEYYNNNGNGGGSGVIGGSGGVGGSGGYHSSRLANLIRNGGAMDFNTFSTFSNLKGQQRHSSTIDLNTQSQAAVNAMLNNSMNSNDMAMYGGSGNGNGGGGDFSSNLNSSFNTFTSAKSPTLFSSVLQQQQQQQQQQHHHHQHHHHHQQQSSLSTTMHHTWCGRLPPKIYSDKALYSRKVFLGGLPWDVNQQALLQLLNKYGPVKLEIPGKDAKHPRVSSMCKTQERSTPGYVYIIYENESAVQRMLSECRKEYKNGGEHYFYTIFIPVMSSNAPPPPPGSNMLMSNKRGKAKEVEVIPWNQDDTSYVPQNKTSMLPAKIDAKSTIFVGALHGMLNAHGLAKVMNEIFGEVIHAGLDTDKYKYPIGSGRVTFRNRQSYIKAIKAKFVTIKANMDASDPSPKFEKTIQIDPYLEDAKCCKCDNRSVYFCRNEFCLDYYCSHCWTFKHDTKGNGEHLYLSRQNKPNHG